MLNQDLKVSCLVISETDSSFFFKTRLVPCFRIHWLIYIVLNAVKVVTCEVCSRYIFRFTNSS